MILDMPWYLVVAHWIVSALALGLAALLTPGFRVNGFLNALVASLMIGLANTFVRPVLVFLTLPLTVLTLGLFLFVVDAIILRLCAAFLKGVEVTGWLSAIFGAILLSVTSSVLHYLLI